VWTPGCNAVCDSLAVKLHHLNLPESHKPEPWVASGEKYGAQTQSSCTCLCGSSCPRPPCTAREEPGRATGRVSPCHGQEPRVGLWCAWLLTGVA